MQSREGLADRDAAGLQIPRRALSLVLRSRVATLVEHPLTIWRYALPIEITICVEAYGLWNSMFFIDPSISLAAYKGIEIDLINYHQFRTMDRLA